MSSKRMRESAVSSVVAAVLLFALFSASFLLWTLNTQPEWVADREHNHLTEVKQDLGELQSSLERLSELDSSGPASQSIDLAAPKLPLLQSNANSGQLSLPDGARFQATFANANLHAVDNQPVGEPSEPVPTSSTNVMSAVKELRMVDFLLTSPSNNDWVELEARDDSKTATIRFTFDQTGCTAGGQIEATTQFNGGPWTSAGSFCAASTDIHIDALDRGYGYSGQLARLESGFDVYLDSSATAHYSAVWINSLGHANVAGGGENADGFALDLQGKRLKFESNAQEFPDQTVFWDLGAIIADQGGQGSIARDPSFLLDSSGANGFLRWTVVELSGSGGTGGDGDANIIVTHDATERLLFSTTDVTFTVTSEAGDAWREFFDDMHKLENEPTSVTLGGSDDTATIQIDGLTWYVELRVIHATVNIR